MYYNTRNCERIYFCDDPSMSSMTGGKVEYLTRTSTDELTRKYGYFR